MTNEEFESEREAMIFGSGECTRLTDCKCFSCQPELIISPIGSLAAASDRPVHEHPIGCECKVLECGWGIFDAAKRRYQDHLLKIMDAVARGEALSRLKEKADEEKA